MSQKILWERHVWNSQAFQVLSNQELPSFKGFNRWEEVAFGISSFIESNIHLPFQQLDSVTRDALLDLIDFYTTKNFPVCYLQKPTGEKFLELGIPSSFQISWNRATGIILLPDDVLESPEKEKVKWIVFTQRLKGDKSLIPITHYSELEYCYPQDMLQIVVGGDTVNATFFSRGILRKGKDARSLFLGNISPKSTKEFLKKAQAIVLQSLLWSQKNRIVLAPQHSEILVSDRIYSISDSSLE